MPEHRTNWFDHLLGMDHSAWARISREGRQAFIWRENVKRLGIPSAIVVSLFTHFGSGGKFAGLWSRQFAIDLLEAFCVTFISFYIVGQIAWEVARHRYRTPRER